MDSPVRFGSSFATSPSRISGLFGGEKGVCRAGFGIPLPLTFRTTGELTLVTLVPELKPLEALELVVTRELGELAALALDIVLVRTGTGGIGGRVDIVDVVRVREPDGVGGVDFGKSAVLRDNLLLPLGDTAVDEIVRVRVAIGFSLSVARPGADDDDGMPLLLSTTGDPVTAAALLRMAAAVAAVGGLEGPSPGLSFRYEVNHPSVHERLCVQ